MKKNLQNKTITIGVTGHRNFSADDARLSALVQKECAQLAQDYPDHSFIIFSALAEGADRLVTRVAQSVLKARLVVPLVLPLEGDQAYIHDFPETVEEFNDLLKTADKIIESPIFDAQDAKSFNTKPRNLHYAWGGAFLVAHCDILFALWDGKLSRGVGGTADVVHWFEQGKVPKPYDILLAKPSSSQDDLPVTSPQRLIHITPESGKVIHKDVQN